MSNATRQVVRCQECQTPVFEFRAGMLVLKARHNGSWHITMLRIEELRAMLDAYEASSAAGSGSEPAA